MDIEPTGGKFTMPQKPARLFAATIAGLVFSFSGTAATADTGYRHYAVNLVKAAPKGTRFRPDLEAYLNRRASTARRKHGRSAVKAGSLMRTAARAQALDMALGRYIGHDSRRGDGFTARFAAFARGRNGHRGENAARNRRRGPVNTAKAAGLFNQWLNSPGHRANLMGSHYRFVATGAVQRGNHLYAVQIFWGRLSSTSINRCTTPLIC